MDFPNSLVDYLLLHAQRTPHRLALLDTNLNPEKTASWKTWLDIAHETLNLARRLRDQGIGMGSMVVSTLPNSIEWITLDLACQTLGAIHAPIDARYPELLINSLMDLCRPSLLVTKKTDTSSTTRLSTQQNVKQFWCSSNEPLQTESASTGDTVTHLKSLYAESFIERSNLDTATVLFTSGSTDSPKGVKLSHLNLISNALGKLSAMPQFSSDRRLNFLPFSHAYARTCELSTWLITGGQLVLARDIRQVARTAQDYSPTLLNGVPLFFETLHRELSCRPPIQSLREYLGGNIRQLASGGAALTLETATYFESANLPILVGYGLTEASPVVCSNLSKDGRTTNVGPPIPGVTVRVDREGELWVRGSGVMQGYINNPAATALSIIDGELRTGDLAEIDHEGRVRLVGRLRDTIVLSSGVKISPYQVEHHLKYHTGVEEAVVIGEGWERAAAIVVASAGLWKYMLTATDEQQRELLANISQHLTSLPKYATPVAWVFRKLPFSSNPNLVNLKGAPRRDVIRLQYEPLLRESIRSGRALVHLDADF